MAKSGLTHIDVGPELSRTEWESEETHALINGSAFPASPVERQLFYRNDLHEWYIYDGSAWVSLQAAGGGSGDMLKSVYDTDDDGIVDNSEKLEGSTKSEVQNHSPIAHAASHQDGGADELSIAGLAGESAELPPTRRTRRTQSTEERRRPSLLSSFRETPTAGPPSPTPHQTSRLTPREHATPPSRPTAPARPMPLTSHHRATATANTQCSPLLTPLRPATSSSHPPPQGGLRF